VRGTIAGKGELTLDATARVDCAVQPSFAAAESASHTLQNRDRGHSQAPPPRLIEATREAIADGSGPRLGTSRSWA
jgi:hypothetical protein